MYIIKNLFVLFILFSSIDLSAGTTQSTGYKICMHNGKIFDLIEASFDCFFTSEGQLNDKMKEHHKSGLITTNAGIVYSIAIQSHVNYTKVEKALDLHDPRCIPSHKIIGNIDN